jgi:hypothetical protein
MVAEYDDWGNPTKPRYEAMQHDHSLLGTIKFYSTLTFRRYRNTIWTILFAICLLWYMLRDGGPPKDRPVDWNSFAYVQYAMPDHASPNGIDR